MAVLIGMSEEVRGKKAEIDKDEFVIGRKSENDISIDNPTVSGKHCIIVRTGNRYMVRDMGSTNGTSVNSREITESGLKPKDILRVGSIEFLFDATPGEVIEKDKESTPEVEVAPGPAAAPESFGSISPFGTRGREARKLWYMLITAIGILALVGVFYFFYILITDH